MDPGSPLELESQIASEDAMENNDSDAENHNPASSLLEGFATQLPLSELDKPKDRSKKHLVHTNALLDQLPTQHNPQPLQHPLGLNPNLGSLPKQYEDSSSPYDLSQRPLVAPASTAPSADMDAPTMKEVKEKSSKLVEASHVDKSNEIAFPDSVPAAVLEVLRAWRQECYEGRYIPRRLQVIPKDQAKILDSEDSWQPALVGHTQRQGTVPVDLLNELCQIADQDETSNRSLNHIDVVNTEAEKRGDGRVCHHQREQQEDRSKYTYQYETDPESKESGESEQEDWSPSPPQPPRAYRELPPDSSPPTPFSTRKSETRRKEGDITEERSNSSQSNLSSGEVGPQSSSVPTIPSQKIVRADDQLRDDGSRQEPIMISQSSSAKKKTDLRSSSLNDLLNSSASLQRTIQVKRTPFHVKEALPSSSVPDFSMHVVPATFDEKTLRVHRSAEKHPSMTHNIQERGRYEPGSEDDRGFEADSSEDDLVARRSQGLNHTSQVASSATADQTNRVKLPGELTNSTNAELQGSVRQHKRKHEPHSTNQNKRHRGSNTQQVRCHNHEQSSDYGKIDEERIQYRRKYLNQIGRKRGESKNYVSQCPASTREAEAETATSYDPVEQETSSKRSDRFQEPNHTEDPDFIESVHRHSTRPRPSDMSVQSWSPGSISSRLAASDLFDVFRTTYPSYDGHRSHFLAACRLLSQLQLEGKATHQSLWDDFIYRHFHDYRQYLQEILETCGSALPYEQFYDKHVEQPTHLSRLVKPSELANFLKVPGNVGSSLRLVKPDNKVNKSFKAHSIEGSVHVSLAGPDQTAAGQSLQTRNVLLQSAPRTASQVSSARKRFQASEENIPPQQLEGPSTSVRLWLERVAGNESPILGTPIATQKDDMNVPILDLDHNSSKLSISAPTSTKHKKKRSLPWPSTTEHNPSNNMVTVEKTQVPSTHSEQELRSNGMPIIKVSKISKRKKSSHRLSSQQKHQAENQPRETAFQRWTKLYLDLPGEKEALEQHRSRAVQAVDITGWRS